MAEKYIDIPFQITTPLEKRMAEVFFAYDHDSVNMINKSDLGSALRSLGCVPTEEDIAKFVEKTEFYDRPGDIHITKFMSCLKMLLLNREMMPSPPEDLLEAFKVFDPKKQRIHREGGFFQAND